MRRSGGAARVKFNVSLCVVGFTLPRFRRGSARKFNLQLFDKGFGSTAHDQDKVTGSDFTVGMHADSILHCIDEYRPF